MKLLIWELKFFRRKLKILFIRVCMNLVAKSVIIGILYVVLKMALRYKESPKPNLKDGLAVFICSLSVLYGIEQYNIAKPKITEVLTTPPDF